MRTLLICAGVCLTAGTYVAAERFTSSTEQTIALEQQAAAQAAIDEQIKQSNAKFVAEIAALEDKNEAAMTQIASLNGNLADITSDRDELASKVEIARSTTDMIRETIDGLEATNTKLADKLAIREASLAFKETRIDALQSEIEALAGSTGSSTPNISGDADLIAEIASLSEMLTERDATIAQLQDRIESATLDASITGAEDANAALVEELQAAKATIEELSQTASLQTQETEESLAAMTVALRESEAQVALLEAQISASDASADLSDNADGAQSEELVALSDRLTALSTLVDEQTKTISNLRMGFEEEHASPMEMANACIERANKIFEISQIKFATGTSTISDQSIATLDHLRDLAIGCESEEMFIEIGGHTDSQGAESANQSLSEARAASVRDFLIGRGIPEDTMVAVGYGETQPIATNDTAVGRAQNRRITFTWQMREKTPDVDVSSDIEIPTENIDG